MNLPNKLSFINIASFMLQYYNKCTSSILYYWLFNILSSLKVAWEFMLSELVAYKLTVYKEMYVYLCKICCLKKNFRDAWEEIILITANEKFNFLMQIKKGFCKNNAYQEKIKHYVMNALKCNPPSLNIFLLPHPRGLPNQFILALYNHWMTPNQLSSP